MSVIAEFADVDQPWDAPDVPLATVPGQVMGIDQARFGYRMAECLYVACVARWGEASDEAQFAGNTVHAWMQDLFLAGGTAADIETAQREVGQVHEWQNAQQ